MDVFALAVFIAGVLAVAACSLVATFYFFEGRGDGERRD